MNRQQAIDWVISEAIADELHPGSESTLDGWAEELHDAYVALIGEPDEDDDSASMYSALLNEVGEDAICYAIREARASEGRLYEIFDSYNTVYCGTLEEAELIVADWMPDNWSPPNRDGRSAEEWSDALAEYSGESPTVAEID